MIKAKSANGVTGHLIYNMDGDYYFRVYHGEEFIDHKVAHCDLTITIKDEDAFFYEKDGEFFLDHAPDTLGMTDRVEIEYGI